MDKELSRAVNLFKYVRGEREHHQELFEKGKREMLDALRHIRVDPEAQRPTSDPQQKPADVDQKQQEEKSPVETEIKKLYRKIVQETHPDKTEKMGLSQKEIDKRVKAYQRAAAALRDADSDTLVEIAVDLDLDTGFDDLAIAASLRRRSKILEDEIARIRNSIEWYWINATEENKIAVIKELCKRNGWIYVTDEMISEGVKYATGVHPGSKDDIMNRARKKMQERKRIS
jgi:hypothetical protein